MNRQRSARSIRVHQPARADPEYNFRLKRLSLALMGLTLLAMVGAQIAILILSPDRALAVWGALGPVICTLIYHLKSSVGHR